MFWFDKRNPDALFLDKRRETLHFSGNRVVAIEPDVLASFASLPFPNRRFNLVVLDPPHLVRAGRKSWLAQKYGKLEGDWKSELTAGFSECFRVLKSGGVFIFKWNEYQIPVSQILALTPVQPLFGNRCGRASKTHWIVFLKK